MRVLLFGALVALAGCVSTEMRKFVGQDISEVMIRYGQPEHVIAMPDGRRAFQFRHGGGPVVVPGTTSSTVTSWGNTAYVNTTAMPAMAFDAPGCLLTFLAVSSGGSWRVSDVRVPKQLVC